MESGQDKCDGRVEGGGQSVVGMVGYTYKGERWWGSSQYIHSPCQARRGRSRDPTAPKLELDTVTGGTYIELVPARANEASTRVRHHCQLSQPNEHVPRLTPTDVSQGI